MSAFAALQPFKLYYFDIAGRGEPIRLACAYGNVPFEDIRTTREEFAAMKESGKLPFGQLPVVELADGKVLAQTVAIMRFVGKQSGLYPPDPVQAAVVDSLLDQDNDMFAGLGVTMAGARVGFANLDPDYRAQVRKALNDEVLPRHLQYFENFLAKSTSGWLAGGEEPSIADFLLVPRFKFLVTPGLLDGISTELLEPFPLVKALITKFYDLPAIKAYYAPKA